MPNKSGQPREEDLIAPVAYGTPILYTSTT